MRVPRALAAICAAALFSLSFATVAQADDTDTPYPVAPATTEAPSASAATETAAPPSSSETTTAPAPSVTETTTAPAPSATETTTAPVPSAIETTTAPVPSAPETTTAPSAPETSASPSGPSSAPVVLSEPAGEGDGELASPVPTVPASPTGVIESVGREGCDVMIHVTTTGVGSWTLKVWDDGDVLGVFSWDTTTADAHTAVWTITAPAGTSSPGVGFHLYLGSNSVDSVDPWTYPDDVAASCAAVAEPLALTLPDYSGSTHAGDTLQVHGTGYLPGESVAVSFGPDLVGTYPTDSAGAFTGTFVVPAGATPDTYEVVGVGQTSERTAQACADVVAPVAGGHIGEITRNGCVVTIPVITTGPGTYTLTVWDDGVAIDTFTWTVTEPGTHMVMWTITRPAGKGATGVGFGLTSGGSSLDSVDPYEYPDDVADHCSAVVPVTIALPDYTGPVLAGTTLQVTGTGYLPGEQVQLVFASVSTVVGTVTTDSTGAYATTFVVPADATVDTHHITGTGLDSGRAATAELAVMQTPEVMGESITVPTGTVATLASTGSEVSPLIGLAAAGLVVAGAGALVLGHRRKANAS